MKSSLVKLLCKDCFSAFLALTLVVLAIVFVTITCIAAPQGKNYPVHDDTVSHALLNTTKESLKKKDMEIEEWLRSREPSSLMDLM
jgi:hypothetical protein